MHLIFISRTSQPAAAAVLGQCFSQHSARRTAWAARTCLACQRFIIARPLGPRKSFIRSCREARHSPMQQTSTYSQNAGEDAAVKGNTKNHNKVLDLLNDSTKWVVSSGALATMLWRRDAETLWCITGSVVASLICKVTKRLVNESRPANARAQDPGMPSSHANSLAFFGTYIVLSLTVGMRPAAASICSAGAVAAITLGLAWLRVLLGYHTYPQLVAGLLLGAGVATCWWALFWAVVAPAIAAEPANETRLIAATAVASAAFATAFFRRWAAGRVGSERRV